MAPAPRSLAARTPAARSRSPRARTSATGHTTRRDGVQPVVRGERRSSRWRLRLEGPPCRARFSGARGAPRAPVRLCHRRRARPLTRADVPSGWWTRRGRGAGPRHGVRRRDGPFRGIGARRHADPDDPDDVFSLATAPWRLDLGRRLRHGAADDGVLTEQRRDGRSNGTSKSCSPLVVDDSSCFSGE